MELYAAQPGDTLYDITLSHRLSMGQFLSDNGLNSHKFAVGQVFLVQKGVRFHMVRTGESLPSIAEEHHMTVERLRRLNPGVDRVFPGQRLILQREQADRRPALVLNGKFSVTLPLLTPEERSGRQYEKLDFEGQAARVDFVLLSTPEEHRPAPLPRLRTRLESALTLIPRKKIILLLDGQGRDKGNLLSRQEAEALAAEQKAAIRFDPAAGLAHFRYSDPRGREHPVKFPDLRSLSARLELAAELGIPGVSLPSPSPADLLLLESRFQLEESPQYTLDFRLRL